MTTRKSGDDPRRPIFKVVIDYVEITDGETDFHFTLIKVWPRRATYRFRCTATPGRGEANSIEWKMGGEGKLFDPVLMYDEMPAEHVDAFAFAAQFAHMVLVCDTVINTPRGMDPEQARRMYRRLNDHRTDHTVRQHVQWAIDDLLATGDLTLGAN